MGNVRPDPEETLRQFRREAEAREETRSPNSLSAIIDGCKEVADSASVHSTDIWDLVQVLPVYNREDVEEFAARCLPEFREHTCYTRNAGLYLSALVNRIGRPGEVFTLRLPYSGKQKLDSIGNYLDGPTLLVYGHVGACLGFGMRSGLLRLQGAAGDSAGMGMHGGVLEIDGTVRKGLGEVMQGGIIRLRGRARGWVAKNARAGKIDIEGFYRALANDSNHYYHSQTFPISSKVTITHNGKQVWPR